MKRLLIVLAALLAASAASAANLDDLSHDEKVALEANLSVHRFGCKKPYSHIVDRIADQLRKLDQKERLAKYSTLITNYHRLKDDAKSRCCSDFDKIVADLLEDLPAAELRYRLKIFEAKVKDDAVRAEVEAKVKTDEAEAKAKADEAEAKVKDDEAKAKAKADEAKARNEKASDLGKDAWTDFAVAPHDHKCDKEAIKLNIENMIKNAPVIGVLGTRLLYIKGEPFEIARMSNSVTCIVELVTTQLTGRAVFQFVKQDGHDLVKLKW